MMNLTSPLRPAVAAILLAGCLGLPLAGCGDDARPAVSDTTTPEPDVAEPGADGDTTDDDAATCAEGTACDDGDDCTTDDACDAAGMCRGTALSCDDGLACTTDACVAGSCEHTVQGGFCVAGEGEVCVAVGAADPFNGCKVCAAGEGGATFGDRVDGFSCSDGDACTTSDTCQAGACVGGAALTCTSSDPCVERSCDSAVGCVDTFTEQTCDDGDPCTVGDSCREGLCRAGEDPLDCTDEDPCTTGTCEPGIGCVQSFSCDDGDPCTNDSCDAVTGACTNTLFVGACEDGNPCTENETCNEAGVCGGGTPVSCDDGNVCTVDICDAARGGCLGLFVTADCNDSSCTPAPCDDGNSCTLNDQCVAGACFGGKTRECGLCPVTPTDRANKIVRLEISGDGRPGSGLDLDDDPDTCAPFGDCGGGVDNALAPLAGIMGSNIQASVDDGVVMWIVDFSRWQGDDAPFAMAVYDSGLADSNLACDYQGGPNAPDEVTEICDYSLAQLSFDADCVPYFAFDNAVVDAPKITAGSQDTVIRMVLPLASGSLLGLTIANARFEGALTFDLNGQIASVNGILGGAVPKVQLIQAVLELRPEDIGGIDPTAVVPLIELLVENDIDLDGDGLDDAASVAIRITTIPARIVE
jgi:hypothetical protein